MSAKTLTSREVLLGMSALVLVVGACGGRTDIVSDWAEQTSYAGGEISHGGHAGEGGRGSLGGAEMGSAGGSAGAPSAQGGSASSGNGGGAGANSIWRQSSTPLCSHLAAPPGRHSLWSDGKSVYLAGADSAGDGLLYVNSGFGWSERTFAARDLQGVTGFPGDARLFLQQNSTGCGVALLLQDSIACSAPTRVEQAIVVRPALAFALAEGGQVIRFDVKYWTQLGSRLEDDGSPAALAQGSLWGTEKRLFVSSVGGRLYRFETPTESGAVGRLEDAPPFSYSALFGFSERDVWAGTTDGALLHFDGSGWTQNGSVPGCGGVRAIWGVNGALFAISKSAFVRLDQGQVHPLAVLDCDGPEWVSLWGDSADSVYLAQSDTRLDGSACGGTRLSWFDGTNVGAL